MEDSSSENIGIAKLKGTENWTSWYDEIRSKLILRNLWGYAQGRIVEPVALIAPKPTAGSSSRLDSAEAEAQEKYQKALVVYEEKFSKWERSQEMIIAIIILTCEVGPRVHLTNVTNGKTALEILKELYEGTDLFTIDISFGEIARSKLENFASIEAYAQHLKAHREKIFMAGENIPDWLMSSAFRMGLPSRFNPYVFQLEYASKNLGKVLTIDEMVAALKAY